MKNIKKEKPIVLAKRLFNRLSQDDTLSDGQFEKKTRTKSVYERLASLCASRHTSRIWEMVEKGLLPSLEEFAREKGTIEMESVWNRTSNSGASLLSKAISKGKVEMIDFLIASGSNPRIQNIAQKTVLHVAIERSSLLLISTLLSHGALLHLRDSSGNGHVPLPTLNAPR